MAKFKLHKAVKYIKPIKMLLYGPTHAGKTYSSLLIGAGIVMKKRGISEQEAYKHILLIDSEYKRGTLYHDLGDYNYHEIQAPYYPDKLIEVLNWAKDLDQIDVVIIDSITHFWAKSGGVLDLKAKKDAKGGNSYANWQEFTALFNKVMDLILETRKHIIVTARSKNDTVLELNDRNKAVPKTYGLKPEVRDGIEYDFDVTFNVDKATHTLILDKGLPGMAELMDKATPQTGQDIYDFFNTDAIKAPRKKEDVEKNIGELAKKHNKIQFVQLKLSGKKLKDLDMQQLLKVEKALKEEIKGGQTKKGK